MVVRVHPIFIGLANLALVAVIVVKNIKSVPKHVVQRQLSILGDTAPVPVQVFTEALCPDCKHFLEEQLERIYKLLGPDIMELTLVPFGNAELDREGKTIRSQHGVGECDANLWEQCAIHLYPSIESYLPFIACLDGYLPMGSHDDVFERTPFQLCAAKSRLDYDALEKCHDDDDLSWKLALEFDTMTPDEHEYVPWVVIDGQSVDPDQVILLEEVCKVYLSSGGRDPACAGFLASQSGNILID